jgi:hypothetical protein
LLVIGYWLFVDGCWLLVIEGRSPLNPPIGDEPSTSNKQPSTNNHQQTTNNHQQTTNNQ